MSSIQLPRMLQTKKTNGELEKEQLDKQMVIISFGNAKTTENFHFYY